MAALRLRSPLLPVLLCASALVLLLEPVSQAFAGSSVARQPRALTSQGRLRNSQAALPHADSFAAVGPDSSAILLADSTDAIPLVAFLVSIFVGIVGYSVWTAFGPASDDLRDPFEEHED
mmetsp:Transcript_4462/g.10243  ORF Transcript_4462/g.10243 Transcript_4462/m.10243 type:complete len:120 (+) Transcript_4462:104-463(+)